MHVFVAHRRDQVHVGCFFVVNTRCPAAVSLNFLHMCGLASLRSAIGMLESRAWKIGGIRYWVNGKYFFLHDHIDRQQREIPGRRLLFLPPLSKMTSFGALTLTLSGKGKAPK